MKEIENNMYYQTGIKTSRNEDSVYAMKYASQQMMIDKLQKENEQLKENNLAMQEEMARTWAKLQQKDNIINKAKEFAKEHIFQFDGDKDFDALLEILDNKGE